MTKIPQFVFNIYNQVANAMVDENFGKDCKLIYPPIKQPCPNCTQNGISSNHFASGGPAPFNQGVCPACGGEGLIEVEQSDIIKLRVYYTPKFFIRVGNSVEVPEDSVQVIGKICEIHKFKNASTIIVDYDEAAVKQETFERAGDISLHGLTKQFFVCFLKSSE